jgi:hypothetical protein
MRSLVVSIALVLSFSAAADELSKARELAKSDAGYDALYRAAVMAYEVAKVTDNPTALRRDAVAFGIATAERAAKLKAQPFEALVYESLFLRFEAQLAPDEAKREKLTAEAEAIRTRAYAIAKEVQNARLAESGWTRWEIWIVQDDKILFEDDGVLTLARKPFSIYVMMPGEIQPVMLNASSTDRVFKRIVDGFDLVKDCQAAIVAMCGGTGMAEQPFNKDKRLVLGDDRIHYLYYDGPDDHRYSRYEKRASLNQLERDVAILGDTPIEKTTIDTLYLLFAVRTHDDGKLHEDELRRVKIRFR